MAPPPRSLWHHKSALLSRPVPRWRRGPSEPDSAEEDVAFAKYKDVDIRAAVAGVAIIGCIVSFVGLFSHPWVTQIDVFGHHFNPGVSKDIVYAFGSAILLLGLWIVWLIRRLGTEALGAVLAFAAVNLTCGCVCVGETLSHAHAVASSVEGIQTHIGVGPALTITGEALVFLVSAVALPGFWYLQKRHRAVPAAEPQ